MDDAVAQASTQPLPELVRVVLRNIRSLQLAAPSTFQHEQHAQVLTSLSAACDKLSGTVEDHRLNPGHERWETGDEASIELFGELSVRQAKEFLQRVMHELAYLGIQDSTQSTSTIDAQLFDLDWRPLLPADQAAPGDDTSVVPLPEDHIAVSTERKSSTRTSRWKHTSNVTVAVNSFKTPTAARPPCYQTPPRGPSCSPITPASRRHTEASNDDSNTNSPHPPYQHSSGTRSSRHASPIIFESNEATERMFEEPTPDIEQEVAPPQFASQPGPTVAAAQADAEAQAYMASVRAVEENIDDLVFLLQIRPRWSADVDNDTSSL